jgi:hypothetical protein
MSMDNKHDESRAFFDMIPEINVLNYALGEWNDQYDRMQQQKTDN